MKAYRKKYINRIIIFLITLLLSFPRIMQSEEGKENCMRCHGMKNLSYFREDAKTLQKFYVNKEEFKNSVHAEIACESCHTSTSNYPHNPSLQKVSCKDGCHASKDGKEYTHNLVVTEFNDSIHTLGKQGKKSVDSPDCVSCHGFTSVHSIKKATKTIPDSEKISECILCHDNREMMARNKVDEDAVHSYRKSFHYKAIKFGGIPSATCQDCHGVHKILSPKDFNSTVSLDKRAETCGKNGCHEGANINFAMSGANHLNHKIDSEPILYYEEKMFQILTGGTMGMLVVGIIMDIQKKFGWMNVVQKVFFYLGKYLELLLGFLRLVWNLIRKL